MKTLEEHKKKFLEMEPITGCFLSKAGALGLPTLSRIDHLNHLAQAERDVRRLGLHRVIEAIELTREELRAFIQFLIDESRERQANIEEQLKPLYQTVALLKHVAK